MVQLAAVGLAGAALVVAATGIVEAIASATSAEPVTVADLEMVQVQNWH